MQLLRQHRRPVSAHHLAKALGVSLRSIYRDVEALRAQGAELEGEAGVGYRLKPGLLLPAMVLDEAELLAWLRALRALPAGPQAAGATSLLGKLEAVLPADLWRAALTEAPAKAKPPGRGKGKPQARAKAEPRAPEQAAPQARTKAEPKAPGKAAPQARAKAEPKASAKAAPKARAQALPWPEAPEALAQWPGLAEAVAHGQEVLLSYGSARRALRELSLRPLAAVRGPEGLQLLGWHPEQGQAKAYDWALIRACVPQAARLEGDRQELLARWARSL